MTENEAVKRYEKMVYFHAIRFSGVFEKEDLAAEGFIGVIHACRTYDPARSDNFSTHVGANIKNAMLKYMRRGRSGFSVPHDTELIRRKMFFHELENASPEEIADKLGVTISQAQRALIAAARGHVESLDKPLSDGESLDSLAGTWDDISRLYVQEFISSLSRRDRYVLRRAANQDSQTDIAASLGVSQMSVSRYLRDIGRRYKEEYA